MPSELALPVACVLRLTTYVERALVELAFDRARSGLEVDLRMSTPHGVWGVEVKTARRLAGSDRRALRDVGQALSGRWRGGLVVYGGLSVERLAQNTWAVPVARLLATP